MLTKLSIRHFQKHHKLQLLFDPHVTTLVGPSDVGKSSVIRAIRWAATNKPQGDAYIQDGEKFTRVKLSTSEHTVTRIKGAGENSYGLDHSTFKAFGNDVPPDVSKALGLQEINFQGQYDSPFWFAETAGEVSRQLNKIVNLSIIDSVLSYLAAALRKTRVEIEVIQGRLEEARGQKERLRFTREMARDLERVEALYKASQGRAQKRALLSTLLEDIERHEGLSKNLTTALRGALNAKAKGEAWSKLLKKAKNLTKLNESVRFQKEIMSASIPDLAPLKRLEVRYRNVRARSLSLDALLHTTQTLQEQICQLEADKKQAEKTLQKRFGKTCPLCGRQIQS